MAFEELLKIVLCSGAASELGARRQRASELQRLHDALIEPCNVATTLTRVAGEQSVMNKAQKPNIFVKVPSHYVYIVACDQTLFKASTSLSHQVRLNATILNPD